MAAPPLLTARRSLHHLQQGWLPAQVNSNFSPCSLVGLMLAHRRRRWPNISPTMEQWETAYTMSSCAMFYLLFHAETNSSNCSLAKNAVTAVRRCLYDTALQGQTTISAHLNTERLLLFVLPFKILFCKGKQWYLLI